MGDPRTIPWFGAVQDQVGPADSFGGIADVDPDLMRFPPRLPSNLGFKNGCPPFVAYRADNREPRTPKKGMRVLQGILATFPDPLGEVLTTTCRHRVLEQLEVVRMVSCKLTIQTRAVLPLRGCRRQDAGNSQGKKSHGPTRKGFAHRAAGVQLPNGQAAASGCMSTTAMGIPKTSP